MEDEINPFDTLEIGDLIAADWVNDKREKHAIGEITFINSNTFYLKRGGKLPKLSFYKAREDIAAGNLKVEKLAGIPRHVSGWVLRSGDFYDDQGNKIGHFFT